MASDGRRTKYYQVYAPHSMLPYLPQPEPSSQPISRSAMANMANMASMASMAASGRHEGHQENFRPSSGPPQVTQNLPLSSSVTIGFAGFPHDCTTKEVHDAFHRWGTLVAIELHSGPDGATNGKGFMIFSPPPKEKFWLPGRLPVLFHDREIAREIELTLKRPLPPVLFAGPKHKSARYPEKMTLSAEHLQIGFMHSDKSMKPMFGTRPTPRQQILLYQNLRYREIELVFPVVFSGPEGANEGVNLNREAIYSFTMSLTQPLAVYEVPASSTSNLATVILAGESPPLCKRMFDEQDAHEPGSTSWNIKDEWWRATDIYRDWRIPKTVPTSLKKGASATINIGRWTTYALTFDLSRNDRSTYSLLLEAWKDFDIKVHRCPEFGFLAEVPTPVWKFIDNEEQPAGNGPFSFSAQLMDTGTLHFPFKVRYALEACISEGCFSEYKLTREFVDRVWHMEPEKAARLLEDVASRKKRFVEPMDLFDYSAPVSITWRKPPHYCTYIRSATVTPTTIYFAPPSLEISNRVLRQYREHADRFLRVRFTDERWKGRIFPTAKRTSNELFTRVKRTLMNGISIGDRHYDFLAFGNSQFRENGAYFFCPTPHTTAASIRKWMGDFGKIDEVARYAARLGQCFSTTRAIHVIKPKVVEIPDITGRGCNFTDGVGMVSHLLARMAADEMRVAGPSGEAPSVMQFRLGGAKGVLAVWPFAKDREIRLRYSQYKFDAEYEGLEVVRWSQFTAAHLNRQLITVLSCLGVSDDVFLRKLESQLSDLSTAMDDDQMALSLLQKEVDPNRMTLTIAAMVIDGFRQSQEPFVRSVLHLWRAHSVKFLKEKAKLPVHKGAILLGCVDETGSLKGHFNKLQRGKSRNDKLSSLPEVFVQLSKAPDGRPLVLVGVMLIARNPSLHPGDIRVVRGVDVPALRHLKDVVVFPQTGDKDIPSMCSGGDLDGDDFVVIWDHELLPYEVNLEPMDYTAPPPVKVDHEITVDDITSFFVQFMKNDSLPTIAHAHLATADLSELGIKDLKCRELAMLHSTAVDYAKKGHPAVMRPDLFPKKWPHFMNKSPSKSYRSDKVLGRMYDRIEVIEFKPEYDLPFNQAILDSYGHDEKMLHSASELKKRYDAALRRIMARHGIATEFEVWSTFVMDHVKESKDYKFHEEIGQLSLSLKETYKEEAYELAGGRGMSMMARFVAAMYKVTKDETEEVLRKRRESITLEDQPEMPMISFPWLFPEILGVLARSGKTHDVLEDLLELEPTKPEPESKPLEPEREQAREQTLLDASESGADAVQTKSGTTQIGEILSLFQNEQQGHDILSAKEAASTDMPEMCSPSLLDMDIPDEPLQPPADYQNHNTKDDASKGSMAPVGPLTTSAPSLLDMGAPSAGADTLLFEIGMGPEVDSRDAVELKPSPALDEAGLTSGDLSALDKPDLKPGSLPTLNNNTDLKLEDLSAVDKPDLEPREVSALDKPVLKPEDLPALDEQTLKSDDAAEPPQNLDEPDEMQVDEKEIEALLSSIGTSGPFTTRKDEDRLIDI